MVDGKTDAVAVGNCVARALISANSMAGTWIYDDRQSKEALVDCKQEQIGYTGGKVSNLLMLARASLADNAEHPCPIPDETTILAFRHLLEQHDLGAKL